MSRAAAGIAALALSVLAAPAARAGDEADEAQFHFRRGGQLLKQGRLEEALGEFYASNRLVPNRNVQFNIARVLEELKLFDESFRAFSELGRIDLGPSDRADVDAALARLRAHVALVSVESDPTGAQIFVGRRDLGALGTTPKLLALPPGRARLILDLPGYRAAEAEIEVQRGQKIEVAPKLERIMGRLDFDRLPPAAEVRRDRAAGSLLRTGPGLVELPPGRAVLYVLAPGFRPARLEADVAGDETRSIDVPLTPIPEPTASVIVRANVDGALVRIDGREMGFSPAVIDGVRTGRREIEISAEGRDPYREVVELGAGDRRFMDVRLRVASPEVEAASKRVVRAEDAPASIAIVTAEEIRAFGWTTLSEALSGVRGAFGSNDRTYEAVGFRAFSPPGDYTNRVLVLVDGHPTNDILTGQGYVGHDLDVDLSEVERVEVVRGPGSVLYGTGALFGVVNVVTRRADRGVHARAQGGLGNLGRASGRVTGTAASPGRDLLLSGAGFAQSGERAYDWGDGVHVARLADGESAHHADLAARAGDFSLRAGANDRTKQIPTGAFSVKPEPGTSYRDRRAFAELRWDRRLGGFGVSARAAWDAVAFDGRYLNLPEDDGTLVPDTFDRTRSQWMTGELRCETPSRAGHVVTAGLEWQEQGKLEIQAGEAGTDVPGFDVSLAERVASAYLVDDWAASRRLRVNAGLRLDDYLSTFGATVNPRLAVIARPYAAGNTKLLAGRAFRAPSAYERTYQDGSVTQKPAEGLGPEAIWTGEIEHAHQVRDDVGIVGALGGSRLASLVVLCTDEADGLLVYRNAAEAIWTGGAEGEVRWRPGAGALLSLAYSWQRAREFRDCGVAHPLVNSPEHLAAVRALAPIAPGVLHLGTEWLFDVGRHTRDGDVAGDAVVWNLTLSGTTPQRRLRYFAGVFNLLDVRAGYPVGAEGPTPTVARVGRSFRFGLTLAF